MEELSFQVIILLIAFGFLAAFIDSVVGGGGLISLPALMFVGLSPASAIATNKLAATMGTFTSAMYFIRSGKVDFKIVGKLIPLTIVGAVAGALVVKFIPPDILRPLVLVMLVFIAIYIIAKKNWGVCLPISWHWRNMIFRLKAISIPSAVMDSRPAKTGSLRTAYPKEFPTGRKTASAG